MSKKSSFQRVFEILNKLNNGKKVNINILSDEYDVSVRTIKRDFELIKNVYGDFLIKDKDTYKAIQQTILNDVLNGTELAILASVLNIFSASGSNFKIDKELTKLYKNSTNIYKFINKPFEEIKNKDILIKLEKAITFKQEIIVKYKTLYKTEQYTLKPYKILSLKENFYLASEIDNKYEFILIRVGLIKDVEIKSKTFYIKREIENFINKIQTPWARFKRGEKDITVVLEIEKKISKYFKMKKFLSSQKILEEKEDGNIIVQYEVSDLFEIKELVLQWIDKMKIVEPKQLTEIIKKELEDKLKSL